MKPMTPTNSSVNHVKIVGAPHFHKRFSRFAFLKFAAPRPQHKVSHFSVAEQVHPSSFIPPRFFTPLPPCAVSLFDLLSLVCFRGVVLLVWIISVRYFDWGAFDFDGFGVEFEI